MTTTYYATETMKTIKFGVELEYTGMGRMAAAETMLATLKRLGKATETARIERQPYPSCYDRHIVRDIAGRAWTIMRDGSLDSKGFEFVTPPCSYDDIDTIQEIVRELRKDGAKAEKRGYSYGMHVHIDGGRFSPDQLVRLAKLTYQQEELIIDALNIRNRVENGNWCRKINADFIQRVNAARTIEQIGRAWYGRRDYYYESRSHYNVSRYRGVNFHSLFNRLSQGERGTVEFRWFASTTHAGKVKSWIQLCLALGAKAINSRGATARRRTYDAANTKYAFRTFMIRLGLNGDEFKTLRHHTLGQLTGSSSYARGNDEQARAEAAARRAEDERRQQLMAAEASAEA